MLYTAIVNVLDHHIHLTDEACEILFGKRELEPVKTLSKGEFIPAETVTVVSPKGQIGGFSLRCGSGQHQVQVEILKRDCFTLGIDVPLSDASSLENAAPIKLIGTVGELDLEHAAIIAERHFLMGGKVMEALGIKDRGYAAAKSKGDRSIIFNRCQAQYIGDHDKAFLIMDLEEANAAYLKSGDIVEVINEV